MRLNEDTERRRTCWDSARGPTSLESGSPGGGSRSEGERRPVRGAAKPGE